MNFKCNVGKSISYILQEVTLFYILPQKNNQTRELVSLYVAGYIVLFSRLFTFPIKATEKSRVDWLN